MRNKILVVGGSGFIGTRLRWSLKADNMDLVEGEDARYGIHKKYKTIIFLACNQGDGPDAYRYNLEMYDELDQYRLRHPKTKLIFVSSAAVYDRYGTYAQSKIIGEVYAKRFKNYVILRPSNVYGCGDGHGAPDRFLRGENIIHGNGNQVRDLVSVEQVVDEIIASIKWPNGVYNVSTGIGTSVNEMFRIFGIGKPKYKKNADFGAWESVLEPGRVYD